MDWPAIVTGAQVYSALAWLIVARHFLPSIRRVALNRPRSDWDGPGVWACLMGIMQIAFTIRWVVLGRSDVAVMSRPSLIIWAALYLCNGGVAFGLIHTWHGVVDAQTPARARKAMLLWMFLAIVCVGAALCLAR
jgi:hypothetical protein